MTRPKPGRKGSIAPGSGPGTSEGQVERRIIDQLAATFPVNRSESEWLITLLGAEELHYIFEGSHDDVKD